MRMYTFPRIVEALFDANVVLLKPPWHSDACAAGDHQSWVRGSWMLHTSTS